jgi:hypothetical protein
VSALASIFSSKHTAAEFLMDAAGKQLVDKIYHHLQSKSLHFKNARGASSFTRS